MASVPLGIDSTLEAESLQFLRTYRKRWHRNRGHMEKECRLTIVAGDLDEVALCKALLISPVSQCGSGGGEGKG